MNYIILLSPFIMFLGLLLILRLRISWRNFFALLAFFSIFPIYAITSKLYSVILPFVLFIILLRKDWIPRR